MPVCVKFPEDIDVTGIKKDFAQLESAILSIRKNKGNAAAIKAGMDKVRELLDVQSFIDFLIIQELIYNVELAAPRSMYMHKDKGGKWVMGPLWDFDAGFDFDWGTMTDGHHFFESYKEYVLGPDPIHHSGAYWVPEFFTDIFRSDEFCEEFIARWEEISPLIMTEVWANTEKYITAAENAMVRNLQRWPIYFPSDSWPQEEINFATEIANMYSWLSYRVDHLTPIFNRYLQLD